MNNTAKTRILFFCPGNACRSQMAEGWARYLKPDEIEAYSAGLRASEIDPVVMNLMKAAGVDIRAQRAKTLDSLRELDFDCVVSLCRSEEEAGVAFPAGVRVVRQVFDDPPRLAAEAETEEEAFRVYIRVRDEIRAFVESLPSALSEAGEKE